MAVASYGSLYTLGHKAVLDIFSDRVVIQEKIDGSQISFRVNAEGDLEVRSKGAQLNVVAPDKMFAAGVNYLLSIKDRIPKGFTFRGEYLSRPKHNVLAYDRIPNNHIMVFDVEDEATPGEFLHFDAVREAATHLGFEVVPTFDAEVIGNPAALRALLDRPSVLGGAKIEGVVIKNYNRFGPDKRPLMAKFVSEAFKEVHAGEWRKANPTQGDVTASLVAGLRTPARWGKAVQHLREAGKLTDTPKDIGLLIKEVGEDVEKECADEIKEVLFRHFWPQIRRQLTGGLPEWYKDLLMQKSFE
jgi:hypothetical protein